MERDDQRGYVMQHLLARRWRGWMIVPAIGAAFVGGAVARAQVAGGVINACLNNTSGAVRIVSTGSVCGQP